MIRPISLVLVGALGAAAAGCEGEGGGPTSPTGSGSSETTLAPASILDRTVIFTIRERYTPCVASPGTTIRYFFQDANTIRGVRDTQDVFDEPTTSWNYRRTGSRSGEININWANGTRSEIELSFSSETRGTYEQQDFPAPGRNPCPNSSHLHYSGDFAVERGGPRDGKVVFWTSATRGWQRIRIWVEGRYVGALTSLLNSRPSGCDSPNAAMVVVTLPPGTYSYRAEADSGTNWTGNTFTIRNGSCTRKGLTCRDGDCS